MVLKTSGSDRLNAHIFYWRHALYIRRSLPPFACVAQSPIRRLNGFTTHEPRRFSRSVAVTTITNGLRQQDGPRQIRHYCILSYGRNGACILAWNEMLWYLRAIHTDQFSGTSSRCQFLVSVAGRRIEHALY